MRYLTCWVGFIAAVGGMKPTMLEDIIYQYLPSSEATMSFCSRRLNETSQVGCQSSREPGNRGTLIFIGANQTNLLYYLTDEEKIGSEMAPYSFLMEMSLMTEDNMKKLKHVNQPGMRGGGLVSALIVYRNESLPLPNFSPDYACPGLGPDCSHKWNPSGSGIMWNDYPFPIVFYRNNTIVDDMRDFYLQYNLDDSYPLVQYQISVRMLAAQDTPTCIRRSSQTSFDQGMASTFCDPYGGHNTVTTFPASSSANESVETLPDKSVVALIARSDSLSFFHNTASGVNQNGVSFLFQLAIGKAISLPSITEQLAKADRTIALITLAAEDYKNIGTSSVLYGMRGGRNDYPVTFTNITETPATLSAETDGVKTEIPVTKLLQPKQIKLDSFKNIIELGNLGIPVDGGDIFMHGEEAVSQNVFDAFTQYAASPISVKKATGSNGIPSSTLSEFLNNAPDELLSAQSVYIGDFDTEFKNPFYNSMFDTIRSLGFSDQFCMSNSSANEADAFASLATTIAKSAVHLALEGVDFSEKADVINDIKVTSETIQELLCCYLGNPQECDNVSDLFNVTFSMYPQKRPERLSFSPMVARLSSSGPFMHTASYALKVYSNTMAYYTGINVPCDDNVTDCYNRCQNSNFTAGSIDLRYEFRLLNNNTICMKTPFYGTRAISPAFLIEDYNIANNTGGYSLWSESEWLELKNCRLFLVQSPVTQNIALSVGLISLFVAFFISWTIKWKSSSLFEAPEGIINPVSAASAS